jgi:SAM-dependent methyltransferase
MTREGNMTQPDEIAERVYTTFLYPAAYRRLVSDSRAKKAQYAQIARLLPHVSENKGIVKVLELGPSNTPLLRNAIAHIGLPMDRYRLYGVDKFIQMFPDDLPMINGSITALPIRSNTFDTVVVSSVLFFISNIAEAMDECFRVLRPGGRLILSEPDADIAGALTKRVLAYEFEEIKSEVYANQRRWIGNAKYYCRIFRRIGGNLPWLLFTMLISRWIVNHRQGLLGFTKEELVGFITSAGLIPLEVGRTYADSYFLIAGIRPSIERL